MASTSRATLSDDQILRMIEEDIPSESCSEDESTGSFEQRNVDVIQELELSEQFSSSEESLDDFAVSENLNLSNRLSRNNTFWDEKGPVTSRTISRNILLERPGPRRGVVANTPIQSWDLFISSDMLDEIILCTNREGKRMSREKGFQWQDVDLEELNAFMGVYLMAGVERNWDVPIRELFLNKMSNPIYHATMSVGRFENIRRCLRFDDKRTREERLQSDKLAAFSYIWNCFKRNCKTRFAPGESVTIDEQLVPFRGRCPFRQYMKSKPAKYGIKVFWMCDSETGYACDGIVYVGKFANEAPHRNLGFDIVKELSYTILKSGRNITCDNFFTSVSMPNI